MQSAFKNDDRLCLSMGDDGVAQVRFNRPAKLNALDRAMIDRLIAVGQALHELRGLRAVVLAGEGGAFCAGLDLASFSMDASLNVEELVVRSHGNANRFQQMAIQWRKLPVPVIAAIHGVCFGGGLQIACGADIRVAAPNARLAIMEMKWGIVPDMGGYALWRDLVRDDVLRELIYTNREFSGQEAQELGLATLVDEKPLERATALAGDIARRSPHAIRAAKHLANESRNLDIDAILAAESQAQRDLILSRNQLEAVKSQLEGRRPEFDDV